MEICTVDGCHGVGWKRRCELRAGPTAAREATGLSCFAF